MKLTYALRLKIEEPISQLLKGIGCKSRGRIEILDGEDQVIEFESNNSGEWRKTNWHHKSNDASASLFDCFKAPLVMQVSREEYDHLLRRRLK